MPPTMDIQATASKALVKSNNLRAPVNNASNDMFAMDVVSTSSVHRVGVREVSNLTSYMKLMYI